VVITLPPYKSQFRIVLDCWVMTDLNTSSMPSKLRFADNNELHEYVDALLNSFDFPSSSNDETVAIVSPEASSLPLEENVEQLDFSSTEDLSFTLTAK